MSKELKPIFYVKNNLFNASDNERYDFLNHQWNRKINVFHRKLGFKRTPLYGLKALADKLGVGGIWVKDEGVRNELKAFKALGGSWAIYQYLKKSLHIPEKTDLSFEELKNKLRRFQLDLTFCTATDGNHGAGVAWAARKLGQKAVIYMPQGTVKTRIETVEKLGAEVIIVPGNYDITVQRSTQDAEKNSWIIVSDTGWEGYTEIPRWVIQGYSSMCYEIQEDLNKKGIEKPTHVFVQAGVGSLACSIIGFYYSMFGERMPLPVIMEPVNAACIYHSIEIADGKPHQVKGTLQTIMAGLSCGSPNPVAWEILKTKAAWAVKSPDYVAARGMRILANPLRGDVKIVSGESGACLGIGVLSFLMELDEYKDFRDKLGINKQSQILILNTEADTDPINYRRIIIDGLYPTPKRYLPRVK